MLTTVANNKHFFTKNEIERADKARKYQALIGWPGTKMFIQYVKEGLIKNCDITEEDIFRAMEIYGEAAPLLKGKMKQIKPEAHSKEKRLRVPENIISRNKELIMAVDLFYVNGMPFYVSKTEKINFISVTKLKMRKITTIICCILRDKQKYQSRGFDISDIHADNKFSSKKLEEEILPTILHVYAKEEHVGFIENAIKTVKVHVRTMCHAVP